jgi:transcriptional regulator with XRE-family HTH domain
VNVPLDTVGQQVRRLRAIRNLTQRDLADFAGRSERWIRYLENDRARLDHRTARLLAGGLRVDVAVVLGLAPIPSNLRGEPTTPASFASPPRTHVPHDPDPDRTARDAFRVADRQIGGGNLYAAVLSYLSGSVAPRLLTCQGSSFTSAASLTEMAGWMAHDSGRDEMARAHFDRAWELAQAGQAVELLGDIAAARAHLDLHLGRPASAIAMARRGRAEIARAAYHPALVARLYAMEARGHAALGRGQEAARLFGYAENALGGRESDASAWVAPFDEASLASEVARGLHVVGDFIRARRAAERVIELRQDDRARSRAFAFLSIAQTLLCQPRPELLEACALARRVADQAAPIASTRVSQQLQEVRLLLEPHRPIPEISEFLEASQHGA